MTTKIQEPKKTAAKKARRVQITGAKRAETTAQYSGPERLADHAWKPGQSGNLAGRPKGSRHAIEERFLKNVLADFEENGRDAIAKAREANPLGYCNMIVSLLPKETKLEVDSSDAFVNLWRMVASGEAKRLLTDDDERAEKTTL